MTDVDGDGVAEKWKSSSGSGSQMAGTSWELTLSASGRTISGEVLFGFGSMLSVSEVPQALAEPQNARLREAVEHRLFTQVCDAPDPSLAWLLDSIRGSQRFPIKTFPHQPFSRRPLQWLEGLSPVHPSTHTIRLRDRTELREFAGDSKAPVWVTYSGSTHMKSGIAGDLEAPRLLIERPGRKLLATHHGLILVDTAKRRHAWLWVTLSNFKLRFRSICPETKAVRRNTIEVALDPHSPYDEGDLRPVLVVDLSNGRTTAGTRPKEETWTGCQPDALGSSR